MFPCVLHRTMIYLYMLYTKYPLWRLQIVGSIQQDISLPPTSVDYVFLMVLSEYRMTDQRAEQRCCVCESVDYFVPFWLSYDDVTKWKHFPCHWPFVRRIHLSPVNSPHKGQWRGALMFSLICASINGWVNNREASDFRCHHTHCDITVMKIAIFAQVQQFGGVMNISRVLCTWNFT